MATRAPEDYTRSVRPYQAPRTNQKMCLLGAIRVVLGDTRSVRRFSVSLRTAPLYVQLPLPSREPRKSTTPSRVVIALLAEPLVSLSTYCPSLRTAAHPFSRAPQVNNALTCRHRIARRATRLPLYVLPPACPPGRLAEPLVSLSSYFPLSLSSHSPISLSQTALAYQACTSTPQDCSTVIAATPP
jgi:hypothetical protein